MLVKANFVPQGKEARHFAELQMTETVERNTLPNG